MRKTIKITAQSLVLSVLICGCMSPSGETGRSIKNTQKISNCEINVHVYASSAGSNTVEVVDGIMPELKILTVDGGIAADHFGDRAGSTASASDMLKQSGGSTASFLDALFGSAVRAISPAPAAPNRTADMAGDCSGDDGD